MGNLLLKGALAILFTVILAAIGLIPEMAMCYAWSVVHPVSELARVILALGFWIFGGGMSLLFGFGAVAFWIATMAFIAELDF